LDKRLYRSRRERMVGGVCGGLAEYFDIDVNIIRLIWVFTFFAGGAGLIPYIIALIVLPEEPGSREYVVESTAANNESRRWLAGTILIGLGVFFLINNFMPWLRLERLWPFVLILGGLYIIDRGKKE
jgi:phage shock protein C